MYDLERFYGTKVGTKGTELVQIVKTRTTSQFFGTVDALIISGMHTDALGQPHFWEKIETNSMVDLGPKCECIRTNLKNRKYEKSPFSSLCTGAGWICGYISGDCLLRIALF